MPLIAIAIRIFHAWSALWEFVRNPSRIRSLPWPYLRALARRDPSVAILMVSTPLTLLSILACIPFALFHRAFIPGTTAIALALFSVFASNALRATQDRRRRRATRPSR